MDDENDICAIDYEDDKHDVGTESYERINRQYYRMLMEYLIDQKQDARDELRIYEILDTGLDVNYGCAKEDDKPAECLTALAGAERPLLRVFIRLLKMGAWIGNGRMIIEKLSWQKSVAAAKILNHVVMNYDVVFPNDFFIIADMSEMLDTTIVEATRAGCLITCKKLIELMETDPVIPKWLRLKRRTKVALISAISDLETSEVKPVDFFLQNNIQDIDLFISSGHVPCERIPENRFYPIIFRWCCENGYRHLIDTKFISKMLRSGHFEFVQETFGTYICEVFGETFGVIIQAILTTHVDDIPDVQEIIYEYSKDYEQNHYRAIRLKYFIVSRLSGQTMLDGQSPRICPFSTQKFAQAVSKCIMSLKEYYRFCRHDIHPSELQSFYYTMKEYDPPVAEMISEFASRTIKVQIPYRQRPYPDVFLPCQSLTTEREYRNILLIVWIRDNPQISTIVPSTKSMTNEIIFHIIRFVLFL